MLHVSHHRMRPIFSIRHSYWLRSSQLIKQSHVFWFVCTSECTAAAQIQGIFEDSTQVEQVQRKMPHRSPKSKMALLTEVFGRGE